MASLRPLLSRLAPRLARRAAVETAPPRLLQAQSTRGGARVRCTASRCGGAEFHARHIVAALAAAAVVAGASDDNAGAVKQGLPSYTREEVASHNSADKRIWVTFRDGVYDVTDFVANHPGGDKIMLAAGGALEPFWALYAAHKAPHVYEILEGLRIGNVHEKDRGKLPPIADPYLLDPERDPDLHVLVQKPFNAETPMGDLDPFLTPTETFFTRNHHPVPVVDAEKHRVHLAMGGKELASLSLEDIRTKFKKYDVIVTLQCAGNRRSELSNVKGLQWRVGGISTARWSGARLVDILAAAGVKEAKPGMFVTFEGLDQDMTGEAYGASIPLSEALNPENDIVIAYEMGGEELSRDHGFPLRAILPGLIAARSIKWLTRIAIGPEQAKSFFFQRDYKIIPQGDTFETFKADAVPPVMHVKLSSVFTYPRPDTVIPAGAKHAAVRGWAFCGSAPVDRVEVSADGGKTWHAAKLTRAPSDSSAGVRPGKPWAWVQWNADIPLPSERPLHFVCRAVDVNGNMQPDSVDAVWNLRGIMNSAWHRLTVTGSPNS